MREKILSFLTEIKSKSADIRHAITITDKKNAIEVIDQLVTQLEQNCRKFNSLKDGEINEFLDFFISQLSALQHYLVLEDHKFSVEKNCTTVLSDLIRSGQEILNNIKYKRDTKNLENDGVKAGIAARPDNPSDEQKRVDEQNDLDKDPGFMSLLRSVWLDAVEKQIPSKRIFISYAWPKPETGADEAWSKPFVEKLAFHLVSVGFQVYLDEFQSGAGYSLAQFMKDIKKANHVIVISSRTMKVKLQKPESGVNFEHKQISDNLKQRSDLLAERFIIPVLLNHSNYCHSDFSDLAEIPICSGGYLNAVMELIRRIYRFPAHDFRNWWHAGLKKYEIIKNLWNVPIKNPNFIPRDKTADLQKHFAMGDLRPLALTAHGLGGVGKTQLAVDYVYQNFYLYDEVCWFRAPSHEELEQEYILFGLAKKISGVEDKALSVQQRAQLVKHDLEAKGARLLIYDNALNYDDIKDLLPASTTSNHIIITSRNIKWTGECIEVGVFSLDEAKRYIKQVIQDDRNKDVENSEILIKELGNLPLALAQACAFLAEEKDITIAQYVRMYQRCRKERKNLLKENRLRAGEAHEAVFLTWNITLEVIRKKSSTAESVLQCCAFLDPENIPESLLYEFLSQSGNQSVIQQRSDINLLHQYSMIQRDNQNSFVSVHRLVQDVIDLSIRSEIKTQLINHILRALEIIIERPQDNEPSYKLARIYQPHLNAMETHVSGEQLLPVCTWQYDFASRLYDANSAKKYADKLQSLNAPHSDIRQIRALKDDCKWEEVIQIVDSKLNSSDIQSKAKWYLAILYLCRAQAYHYLLTQHVSRTQLDKNQTLEKIVNDIAQAKSLSMEDKHSVGVMNATIELGKTICDFPDTFTNETKNKCLEDLKNFLKTVSDFEYIFEIKFVLARSLKKNGRASEQLARSLRKNGQALEALNYGFDLLNLAKQSKIIKHRLDAHGLLAELYSYLFDHFKSDAHHSLDRYFKNEGRKLNIFTSSTQQHLEAEIFNLFFTSLGRGLDYFIFNMFSEASIELSKTIDDINQSESIVEYEEPEKEIFDKYLQAEIEKRGRLNVEVKVLAYYYLIKCHVELNNIQVATEVVKQFSDYISKKHRPINFRILSYAYHLLDNTEDAMLEAAFADSLENTTHESESFVKSDAQRQSACSTRSTVSVNAAQQRGVFSQSASSSTSSGTQQAGSGDRPSSGPDVLLGSKFTPASK